MSGQKISPSRFPDMLFKPGPKTLARVNLKYFCMFLKILLLVGALFFFTEFLFHFFGLPVLEHDKIFLPTHDRYIAIMALTYSALLLLISTDLKRYKSLFVVAMVGILFLILNAVWISITGGYRSYFNTESLDKKIGFIGYAHTLWYPLTWFLWFKYFK